MEKANRQPLAGILRKLNSSTNHFMATASRILSIAALSILPTLTASFPPSQVKAAESTVLKQSRSVPTLCETELRSRMGGGSIQVSIRNLSELPTSGSTRLTGSGTQTRGSNSQNFSFSCVINTTQWRVASLSYTFIGPVPSSSNGDHNAPFGGNSGFAPPRVIQIR